jgi:hypothetical protein
MMNHSPRCPLPLLLLTLVALVASACSGAAEYTCPDPVGQIIRDDCAVYKTKYESIKVELGASLGPFGAKTTLGQQSLRDISELLQVFGHRTHALCKDFNACRVPPMEYRQRREATDRTFTSIAAIQGQLSEANLDAASRAKLVQALMEALRGTRSTGATTPTPTSTPAPRRGKTTSYRRGGKHYTSWLPWFGTKLLPPQPAPPPRGFPTLVWTDVGVSAGLRKTGTSSYTSDGYSPSVQVALRGGKPQPDDTITAVWDGGKRTEEPLSRSSKNGLAVQRLRSGRKEVQLKGSSFSVEVRYRRGADGKTASLGKRRFPVVSRAERGRYGSDRIQMTYGIDHDPAARQGQLIFRPVGRYLPPAYEQPHLYVILKFRKYRKPTARCWVDGKGIGTAITPGRGSGQEATFQDRPRYRSVSPGSSVGVKEPFVEWWHYDFPLPFYLPHRGDASAPSGLARWPRAGKWRCVVMVDGEPARELTFTVRSDGRPEPHPDQRATARAEWLLRTKVIDSPTEEPLGRFAHTGKALPPPRNAMPKLSSGRPALRLALQLAKRKGKLSPAQIRAVMRPLRPELRRCVALSGEAGTLKFSAHVYHNGKAGINMRGADIWLRSCISKALKGVRFPKADGYTYFDVTLRTSGRVPRVRRGPLSAFNVEGGHSAAQILEGISKALGKLRACARKNHDSYRIKISVGTDGRVDIQNWARNYHPAVRGCLSKELKQIRLPGAERYTTLFVELRL